MKCICKANVEKTGHREDCPEVGKPPKMFRAAKDTPTENKLVKVLNQLIRKIRAQDERIQQLEDRIKKAL